MSTPTDAPSPDGDDARPAGGASPTAVTAPVTVPSAPDVSGGPGVPDVPGDDEAAERGRLDVALSVVRKIAEYAADHTAGTVRTQRRLAGLDLGESGASARVSGYGEQVDLRLEVPLAYPARITDSAAAVRDHVRDRVQSLTPYRVRSLDIGVSALTDPSIRAAASSSRTPTSRTE
ncbi:Asp23/Gls24 family envelope stress response protein [Actinomycetospora sp. C-140]